MTSSRFDPSTIGRGVAAPDNEMGARWPSEKLPYVF
jgi:hypothetical protein